MISIQNTSNWGLHFNELLPEQQKYNEDDIYKLTPTQEVHQIKSKCTSNTFKIGFCTVLEGMNANN